MEWVFNPFTGNLDAIGAGGASGGVATLTGNTGGAIPPDGAGNINVVGSGSINVAGSGNTLTISGGGGLALVVTNAASVAMVPNTFYVLSNSSGPVSLTLPLTSAVGDIINILNTDVDANGYIITYSTGQQIYSYNNSSTVTVGNLDNSFTGGFVSGLSLVCIETNLIWGVFSFTGGFALN